MHPTRLAVPALAALALIGTATPAIAAPAAPTAPTAPAVSYRYLLPPEPGYSEAVAIDDDGVVLGSRYRDYESFRYQHAFRWVDGRVERLTDYEPAGPASRACGTDRRGNTAAWIEDGPQQGDTRAVVWAADGTVTSLLDRPDVVRSYPLSVTERGDVLIQYFVAEPYGQQTPRAVLGRLSRPGRVTEVPGASQFVTGSGTVAGTRAGATAFVWADGVTTDLPRPGWETSGLTAVSPKGDLAGWVARGTGDTAVSRAALWHHGRLTVLDPLGSTRAVGRGLNDRGEVIGEVQLADGPHGVVWSRRGAVDLGAGSTPRAIDRHGRVLLRDALWDRGRVIDLAAAIPEAYYVDAYDLDDRGHVVGLALVPADNYAEQADRAVLWTVSDPVGSR